MSRHSDRRESENEETNCSSWLLLATLVFLEFNTTLSPVNFLTFQMLLLPSPKKVAHLRELREKVSPSSLLFFVNNSRSTL